MNIESDTPLSQRGSHLPSSPIRKLAPYAEEAEAQGKKVYYLNIGQPDIKTPQPAIDRLNSYSHEIIAYGHSAGNLRYRRKLANYYRERGIPISLENILITTGGSEAILFALLVCFNPGDELIVPEPFYANYLSFATIAGVVVKPLSSRIEEDFRLPPVQVVEELITPRTKGILICHPNNPTGYIYSKEELFSLQEVVKKNNLFLISDEVYKEFCFTEEEHYSVLQLEEIKQQVVMIDSVSKRYSSCGARVGSLATFNQGILDNVYKLCQARLCAPMLGQVVAEAAIDETSEYLERVYQEYKQRRDYIVDELNAIPGVYAPMPRGTFYTMARLPVKDAEAFCVWLLREFSLNGKTLMLAPGSGFYLTPDRGLDEVRIAFVLNIADLREAVKCLRSGLEQYPDRL